MTTAADASHKTLRLRPALCRTLALMLMLASLPLGAQAPQQPPPEPQAEPVTEEAGPGEPADNTAGLPPADAAAGEPEDPFDYEASEQISEDLSVSFPVDI